MKVIKQTSDQLVIQTHNRVMLLALGVVLLVVGILIVLLVRIEPLGYIPEGLTLSEEQKGDADLDPEFEGPSAGKVGFELSRYASRQLLSGPRPLFLAGRLAIMIGLLLVLAPTRSRTIRLDKDKGQIIIQKPAWFFRFKEDKQDLKNLVDVIVEQNPEADDQVKAAAACRVDLVISHSEGIPLTPNYIYYRTIHPLSQRYRYTQETAQAMVERIQSFLKEEKYAY